MNALQKKVDLELKSLQHKEEHDDLDVKENYLFTKKRPNKCKIGKTCRGRKLVDKQKTCLWAADIFTQVPMVCNGRPQNTQTKHRHTMARNFRLSMSRGCP